MTSERNVIQYVDKRAISRNKSVIADTKYDKSHMQDTTGIIVSYYHQWEVGKPFCQTNVNKVGRGNLTSFGTGPALVGR